MELQQASDPWLKHRSHAAGPGAAGPAAAGPDRWLGALLGRYRIVRRLGQGGMGVVYQASDLAVPRSVAVKLVWEDVADDPKMLRRFMREAATASKLSHPNLVCILEIAQHKGTHFIVMELVEGGSTVECLQRDGAFSWERASSIIADVCRGLSAAHRAGLIHRDIKPANILLTADGAAKLGDFGLVKTDSIGSSSLSGSGDVIGTAHYMSPEQCKSEELDCRSDIYSLGATYFALLTGQPPYVEENPLQVMFAHCARPMPDPRSQRPEIPESCVAVLQRALAKHRRDRYDSADAMRAAVEALRPPPMQDSRGTRAGENAYEFIAGLGIPVQRQSAEPHDTPARSASEGERQVTRAKPSLTLQASVTRPPALARLAGAPVEDLTFSPDGRLLAAGLHHGPDAVVIWETTGGQLYRRWSPGGRDQQAGIRCLAFAPDSRTLAAGCRRGLGVHLKNLADDQEQTLSVKGRKIHALAFSPSGTQLAAGLGATSGDAGVFLCNWKLAKAQVVGRFSKPSSISPCFGEPHAPVHDLAFLPLSELLVLGGKDMVWLWDAARREVLLRITAEVEVTALAVAPQGKRVVLAGARQGKPALQFLDLASKESATVPAGSRGSCRCAAFSSDGKLLAVTVGCNLLLWDPVQRQPLTAHSETIGISALAFSPAGNTLATASADGTVRLWSHEELHRGL